LAPTLLDTNVLVHAVYRGSPLHAPSAELVDRGLRGRNDYCIAPQNLVEFAAVVTRAKFVDPPLSAARAAEIAERLYGSRRLAKIYPQRGTVLRAARAGGRRGILGPKWYDLFLAVTMQDAGVSVVITENVGDFQHFPFVEARRIEQATR